MVNNILDAHIYIELPEDYVIFETDSGAILRYKPEIVEANVKDPEIRTIGPKVGGYRVYHQVIVGLITPRMREQEYLNYGRSNNEDRMGYFIVDLHTKSVYGSLSKRDWMAKLKTYGITTEPELFDPSWRDEKLGRNKPQANDAR